MWGSSKNDTSVFDFCEEEDAVESYSKKSMERFFRSRKPRNRNPIVTKDTFLDAFCPGSDAKQKEVNKCVKEKQKEVNNVMCIDFVSSDDEHNCRNDSGMHAVRTSEMGSTVQQEVSEVDQIVVCMPRNVDQHGCCDEEGIGSRDLVSKCRGMHSSEMGNLGVPSMCKKQLNSLLDNIVDIVSDDDEKLKDRSLSTSVSSHTEDEVSGALEQTALDDYTDGDMNMENKVNMKVVISPDFVSYGGRVSTRSQLSFSSDLIKLEVHSEYESNGSFSFEWSLDDVACIECQRSENVDIACVKLVLRPAVKIIENLNSPSEFSKLLLAVSDPKWEEKEQMIISLAARYKSIWNPLPVTTVDDDEDFMGQNVLFFLKRYFSNFDKPFEDVIYPEGDPDAVCISKRDVELLQPATFINDTIIDFYIKYLTNKIQKEDENRFHFFNSFFFRKLADLDKDPRSALEKRVAFLRFRKWTQKVNIFEKDYIFIPVNFNLHWSLIVVCHPGEIPNFADEEIEKASRVPCILHMDSIKGSHRGLKDLFQSYLWEEWKESHEPTEVISFRFSNLRFFPLELPQQENSYDCGLFLLHYVELFLEEAPVNFNPSKITEFNFLSPNWFPPAKASYKRSAIRKLIYEIIDNQPLRVPQVSCSNQNHSEFSQHDLDKEAVEFLSEQHGPTMISCLNNLLSAIFDEEVEIKQSAPAASVFRLGKEMGTLPEFCRHGNTAASCPDVQHPPSDQISTFAKHQCPRPTLEEEEETKEQFMCSSTDKAGYCLPDGVMAETCSTSYSFKDFGTFDIGFREILPGSNEHGSMELLSKCLSNESTTSSAVGVHDSRDLASSNEQVAMEKRISASLENCRDKPESTALALSDSPDPEDCFFEGSPEKNSLGEAVGDRMEGRQSFSTCPENLSASSHQDADSGKNHDTSDDDVCVINDCSEMRSKQLSHKRTKCVPYFGVRRRTRSITRAMLL